MTRVEAAVVELAKLKRGSQVRSRHTSAPRSRPWAPAARRAAAGLDQGGARPSQRNAYARGAKLWAGLRETAVEGAWVEVYTPHFERFLRRFDSPLSDPVLQAGIDAQRKRLAFDQAAYSFGTCATFNKLMRKVREFKIGGSHGVEGDYYAGKIYNDFVRYVSSRQRGRPGALGLALRRGAGGRPQPAQGARRRRGLRELLRLRLQGLGRDSRRVA